MRPGNLARVGVGNMCRIACPVDLNLLCRFTIYVHGGAPFLLILLDVVAELGVHER